MNEEDKQREKSRNLLIPNLIISIYRFGNGLIIHGGIRKKVLWPLYKFLDLIILRFIFNVEIPAQTKIGWGLRIGHPYGIIINENAVIGENFSIQNHTTIGDASLWGTPTGSPTIGNNVSVGVGARVLGNIEVGDSVKIGANAVVIKDCAEGSVMVGIPAEDVRK